MLGSISRFCTLTSVALSAASAAMGLNIVLTNDDSWASANIRYVVHRR
jgi:5'-nucleotidase